MYKLDATTIQILQSRAPGVSEEDSVFLEQRRSVLFRFVDNPSDRDQIWNRLRTVRRPIPTLETFFQDIIYLDVGQNVMQRLCLTPPTTKRTIDQILTEQHFQAPSQYLTDSSNGFPDGMTVQSRLWDLWRFSLQYGFELANRRDHSRRLLRKQDDIDRFALVEADQLLSENAVRGLWCHFFWLAQDHGFSIPTTYEPGALSHAILAPSPIDFPVNTAQDIVVERRCGRPFIDTAQADRFALSWNSLLATPDVSRVSAVSVRQSVFRAFFGYLTSPTFSHRAERQAGFLSEVAESDHLNDEALFPDPLSPAGSPQHSFIYPSETEDQTRNIAGSRGLEHISVSGSARESPQVPFNHFCFEILVSNDLEICWIPNNRDALNEFFENLQGHRFHLYDPDDLSRAIFWMDCYPLYIYDPNMRLRAVYCDGCFEHPWNFVSDSAEIPSQDAETAIEQIKTWVREELQRVKIALPQP